MPTGAPARSRTLARMRAFTLIELIVVILILGILAAIAVVGYTQITERAELARVQADLSSLATATMAQAVLAQDEVITRDVVRRALEENFRANVVVVEPGAGAADTWTLLPADGVPQAPHEVAVGFVAADGSIGDAAGTQAVFVTVTGSGKAVASSVSTVGGKSCPIGQLSYDGGKTWSPADIAGGTITCGTLPPMVDDPECGTEFDSAYGQGYDTASWHRSAAMAYDATIPGYFTFGESCEPDFVRGYDELYYRD